jgi:ABC-type glycerol-3-phosphate transport system permease component
VKGGYGMIKVKEGRQLSLAFDFLNYLLLILFFFVTIYPFYYIFIYSISNPMYAQRGITLLPTHITISNYVQIFKLEGILQAALVSVARTVIGTFLTIIFSTFFAFLVSKREMRFRRFTYRFVVLTMYLNAGLIPWYLTMKAYHLNDNFLLYVIPTAISAYYIILIKTFIEQLPASIEESAQIDGAGIITIFTKIIFPLSMPIIATIAVFASVNQWNTLQDTFFLVQNERLQTLQLILYNYLNQASELILSAQRNPEQLANAATKLTPTAIRMTITMVVTLPILFVYPWMQRFFVKGIMMGAVKG